MKSEYVVGLSRHDEIYFVVHTHYLKEPIWWLVFFSLLKASHGTKSHQADPSHSAENRKGDRRKAQDYSHMHGPGKSSHSISYVFFLAIEKTNNTVYKTYFYNLLCCELDSRIRKNYHDIVQHEPVEWLKTLWHGNHGIWNNTQHILDSGPHSPLARQKSTAILILLECTVCFSTDLYPQWYLHAKKLESIFRDFPDTQLEN